jgi:hypothetical protein
MVLMVRLMIDLGERLQQMEVHSPHKLKIGSPIDGAASISWPRHCFLGFCILELLISPFSCPGLWRKSLNIEWRVQHHLYCKEHLYKLPRVLQCGRCLFSPFMNVFAVLGLKLTTLPALFCDKLFEIWSGELICPTGFKPLSS